MSAISAARGAWGLTRPGWLVRGLRGPLRRWVSPWLKRRLLAAGRKAQPWRFDGLRLRIEPGVFPPGPTLSSVAFVRWLLSDAGPGPWAGRQVLDLGCGSGIVGLALARAGAEVTASDIHPAAVANARANAAANGLRLTAVVADLLRGVDVTKLDAVLITPPYYPRAPRSLPERAWFCGESFDYFHALFAQLAELDLARVQVFMTLSEDCDEAGIRGAAAAHGLALVLRGQAQRWLERSVMLRVRHARGSRK